MQKFLQNELQLHLELSIPEGTEVLVAAPERVKVPRRGKPGEESELTVSVQTAGNKYLPGSSLKGVLRSRAEFIANTLTYPEIGTCHPFDKIPNKTSEALPPRLGCGDRFKIRMGIETEENEMSKGLEVLPTPSRYKDACPACQLFGHTYFAGRLRVTDFPVVSPKINRIRQQYVSINRFTGGAVKGKTFSQESIRAASFAGEIYIENYSIWQLGWLGMLLSDLEDGWITIGQKQTSGKGRLKINSASARLRVLSKAPLLNQHVYGIGWLLNSHPPVENNLYGYTGDDLIETPGVEWKKNNLWNEVFLEGDSLKQLWDCSREKAFQHLKTFKFNEAKMSIKMLESLRKINQEAGS